MGKKKGGKKVAMTEEEKAALEIKNKKYRDLDEMLRVPEGATEWACFNLKWQACAKIESAQSYRLFSSTEPPRGSENAKPSRQCPGERKYAGRRI